MAEIEKKYSDYQKNECDEFTKDVLDPKSPELCPTCQPDPNFKLERSWWDLKEAYLNGLHCEYHVRVYEKEKAVTEMEGEDLESSILHIAAGRVLVDLDKPLNDGTRTQVKNASYIKDTYRNLESKELGLAYLVAVPAFNFDQIEEEDNTSDDNESDTEGGGEFTLSTERLFRKIRQLRRALKTYQGFYSLAQESGTNFVIRQESDETLRINYESARRSLESFVSNLNDALLAKGYAKINRAGIFKSKRPEKIKIVFKDNDVPFDLKAIYVLPDDGCDKYEKLKINSANPLRESSMAVVYNFLQNLDSVISDITAQEPKPWLEFTLDNFYPTYVVDYGDLDDINDTRSGLECLLQDKLGIGNGKIIDSIVSEILSLFDTLEKEMSKEICRAIKANIEPRSATELAEKNNAIANTRSAEREREMLVRYEKEFENKAYKQLINEMTKQMVRFKDLYVGVLYEKTPPKVTRNNLFNLMKKTVSSFNVDVPFTLKKQEISFSRKIKNEEELKQAAKEFAQTKFDNKEWSGGLGDQISNSPHFDEALKAAREVFKAPENTFLQGFKDAFEHRSEFSLLNIISIFGVCGMSKLAGKALECLVGGVSFDKFLGILIGKALEFMEINTLDLFLNGLPADFREELDAEIERQFGDIKLSDLLELKKAENPNQKMNEFMTVSKTAEQLLEISLKIVNNKRPTEAENKLISDAIVDFSYGKTLSTFTTEEYNQFMTYSFAKSQGQIEVRDDARKNALKILKKKIRAKKKAESKYAFDRMVEGLKEFDLNAAGNAIGVDTNISQYENLDQYEQAAKSFEATSVGTKVDAVYDVVFDFVIEKILESFSLDDLFQRMKKFPVVSFIADRIMQFLDNCPTAPIIYPPPGDFFKTLSLDVCDPTLGLTLPKIDIPSINWRFWVDIEFREIFREAIIKMVSDIIVRILKKLLFTLESALCNMMESLGGFAADVLKDGFKETGNKFLDALNEAFCNDGENPDTAKSKAEELADALFSPIMFDAGQDYEGSGAKVANIVSSVASTRDFLSAMVAREGEEDLQFNSAVSNAINALAPEMNVLLGSPNQVAYFFRNLGSYLSPEDKDRIRDLIDAGIPNLPLSPALCLTNEQLNDWDDFRNNALQDQGLTPEQAADRVADLNKKTEDALKDIFDIVGDLETDGPFLGALTNEAMKDVCNPSNVVNAESQSEADKTQEDELTENFFNNIQRSLMNGFMNSGGILAEATADVKGRIEFWRSFQKIFRANYANSQAERDAKYNDKSSVGQWWMDITSDNGKAVGVYPETVAIKQRKEALEVSNQQLTINDNDSNLSSIKFTDSNENFDYYLLVEANNTKSPKNSYDYEIRVEEGPEELLNINVPVSVTQAEVDFMSSQGFQLEANQKIDPRKELFTKLLQKKTNIGQDLSETLYSQTMEMVNKNLIEALLSDYSKSDEIPVGYKFGYVSDDLTASSFEYTPSDKEGELGTFASDRIKPLDPSIYGGSYDNPPFYVEPRQFYGWVEIGTKAFSSAEGCDPKKPPLFDMSDIKDRVKRLNSSLKNDPRLSKPSECVNAKPFHLLLDKGNKAKLDGVIRTTLRTYIGEYFIKGYGLFSNLQIRSSNFDQSMMLYIANSIKREMQELGLSINNRRVRIVRERYWYTFLEQCVEAYQRMVDVDGIKPPEHISEALNRIQMGLDKYRVIGKKTKKAMMMSVPITGDSNIIKPQEDYDPLEVISSGMVNFGLQAVAFRLTPFDERDGFFDGTSFRDIQRRDIRFASMKKLQFFQKIYFIKVFEKEATLIMSELIRDEFDRLANNVIDGISDKPNYYDLYRSFFGMKSFFPSSTSRVGTNIFYSDKQRGQIDTGGIPEIKSSNAVSPVVREDAEKPSLIVESYVRFEERSGTDIPTFIRDRQTKYLGAVSLNDASEFFITNLELMDGKNLSDYFGDLSFTYSSSLRELFEKGFANNKSVNALIELNKTQGAQYPSLISDAFNSYIVGRDFTDIDVVHDESFVLEGEQITPTGTKGSTGVKYGLRLSLVLPDEIGRQLEKTTDMLVKSKEEKAFFFEDGTVSIPLVETEINVKDSPVEDFDPYSGIEPYDLECLINKMAEQTDFQVLMDKLLNLKQTSSMLAIYCMETLPAAIGRDESEREDIDGDPDVDEWDRVVNKFGKNFLRREFRSLYLANHPDGQSDDDDDDSEQAARMRISNPFDFFSYPSLKLPWWKKRRMRSKIYDANGQECADPKKDLQ